MKSHFLLFCLIIIQQSFACSLQHKQKFDIYTDAHKVSIVYSAEGPALDSITANLLAQDIKQVTGFLPPVLVGAKNIKGNVIVVGGLNSSLVRYFSGHVKAPKEFQLQKESYQLSVTPNPFDKKGRVLVIAGTDARGTAFGVFSISKTIGVSPWAWWADVPIKKQKNLSIDQDLFFSKSPAVEYRGIFLNDEDWGLQPWAANTLEPETKDIGPKAYAKIFELLLRLRANTIWPAMHPSTHAFFHYPGNPEMAKKYNIVVGSSHAEPMLRNNVDEWDNKENGEFNYKTNAKNVAAYWENRIKESKDLEAIYTMGMRGIHDSGMEGVESKEEAAHILETVIADQRAILQQNLGKKITQIPQSLTLYKEVLDLYDEGIAVPDDISIVWTDDNYGYIKRLSNENERKRSGGTGVYYHDSYWGRPHDYLWLNSTHPSLLWEEMHKAYTTGAKKIWILNVGDIKPGEYKLQLFFDLAFEPEKFPSTDQVKAHGENFYSEIFGDERGKEINAIQYRYYALAFERKPEFMGWSQTEPITPVQKTAYSPFLWNDEIQARISAYQDIQDRTEKLASRLDESLQNAFFEFVYYPVFGASLMNKKFLYRDQALAYQKEGRWNSEAFLKASHGAYDSITSLTEKYNTTVADGKWNGMMSMHPRDLPVYEKIDLNIEASTHSSGNKVGMSPEKNIIDKAAFYTLPTFYAESKQTHFIDIFLKEKGNDTWEITKQPAYLQFNKTKGNLSNEENFQEHLIVSVDWEAWKKSSKPKNTQFTLKAGDNDFTIHVLMESYNDIPKKAFIEKNGMVVMYAENYSSIENKELFTWNKINDLGYSNHVMQASPLYAYPIDTLAIEKKAPVLTYNLYTKSATKEADIIIHALPTHPITNKHSVRLGVQWDDEPITILDFKTVGRSEIWKQNVLSNTAVIQLPVKSEKTGKHRIKLYMVDPGVTLDYIYLQLQPDSQLPYSIVPETLNEQ
ncbi:glycosyl hydrolase 115 family protein [Mariniflexile sp.]|uniref:glycosyl hydrolase 115 family protein n=2 Tax=Mariniflexile sp. TaxID=1979402 RepID=UPI004047C081